MGLNIFTLGSSKTYTRESLLGGGAVVGKNVTISSITPIEGGNRVTFSYTLDNGTVKTSTMDVMDGIDGLPGKDGKDGLNGTDGIGISKIEKISTVDLVDTYRITFTDNSTFDYEVKNGKDGQGGSGGTVDVPIEKIKVNGELQTPVNKVVDITVPDAYDDTDIRTELANKADTDHTHTTVNGHTVESDVPVDAKFTDTVYDDAQIKTQIQAVANGLMDSVGYSADYKTIDIIAKNGVKKSVNVAPIISHASITELSDVDTTNKATGKALVYNATTSKHEYADVSSTDEKVKMDSSTDAKYLGELLDNVTIANENGELKVKKLDGQEVTITEINYLKGLTMNVMDLVNMFSNGGVKIINTPVATYAELLTLDKSSFIEGVSYLVYVLADENHDNAKTTYLVDKDSETPTYFGFADSQRDFTTNPIDLATEITGKLGISNMDSDAIKALFTVDDTYKTETTTNNAFSTHGAKALYDELLLAIGNKANDSDLTAHKDDTDIHVSTEDRTKWDSAKTHADSAHAPSNAQENVLETVKLNGSVLTPTDKAVNVTVPTTVSELTDSVDYAKKTDIPTTLPANGGNSDTVNNHTVESDVPTDAKFTDTIYDDTAVKGSIAELSSNLDTLAYGENGIENLCNPNKIERGLYTSTDTRLENYFHYEIEVTPNEYYSRTRFDGSADYGGYCFSVLDKNKNCIAIFISKERTIQIPSNGAYLWLQGGETAEQLKNMKYMVVKSQTPPTVYKPYIPSVKMLTEENAQQNTEAMDLKMLGWTVPSECPVQNYVDGDGVFHQRVGRVDLGSLDLTYVSGTNSRFACSSLLPVAKYIDNDAFANAYCTKYIVDTANNIYKHVKDKTIHVSKSSVWIYDTTYTDATTFNTAMKGVYLYYELETEITKPVDGNEAISKVNDSLSVIGKCKNLLNPTLKTTTQNGVTCTNNGDGTYTLNGTASADSNAEFILYGTSNLVNLVELNKEFRLTGCPNNTDAYLIVADWGNPWTVYGEDKGNGSNFKITTSSPDKRVAISVPKGKTVDNIVFKPMITTNLSATYDDFVPYTGDGETLTHDVAEINSNLAVQKLGNDYDGVLSNGYYDAGGNAQYANDWLKTNNHSCNAGDTVSFAYGRNAETVHFVWLNASGGFISREVISNTVANTKTVKTAPTNAKSVVIDIKEKDGVEATPSNASSFYLYINNAIDKLKNDLAPKKIELQNVDERVTIQDNGSFIINGFAFVNLLVTFNETLPQWSNFVRLPRPKGGNVTVYCENSVKLTIYSQDNLPGDCGTYDEVSSGTEIRLLVNYEVA